MMQGRLGLRLRNTAKRNKKSKSRGGVDKSLTISDYGMHERQELRPDMHRQAVDNGGNDSRFV